jgi:DNA repair protein RecN (Recombination protein N)
MPKARFKIEYSHLNEYTDFGQDEIAFAFSANPGVDLDDISKIASGGERSRIMLAIKEMLTQSSNLSCLILDEIDTGVSGEVAHKIGVMMREMSEKRQLLVITHLPQIAAKGQSHFKVLKKESDSRITISTVVKLSEEERVMEIAGLLSGENVGEAAIVNARELIAIK